MSTTAHDIFTTELPAKLEGNEGARSANAVFVFRIEGAGSWTVDLTKDSDWVSEGEADDAACTVIATEPNFVELWTGKLNGMQAFMTGRLKVEGNIQLATKLQSFIG